MANDKLIRLTQDQDNNSTSGSTAYFESFKGHHAKSSISKYFRKTREVILTEVENQDGLIMVFNNKIRKQLSTILICVTFFMLLLTINQGLIEVRVVPKFPPPPKLPLPPNRCFASQQKKVVKFSDTDIINPTFSYPINIKNACAKGDVEIVIPVHSAITNFHRRERTRRFRQGQFASNKRNKILLVFFVGLPSNKLENPEEFQRQLLNESKFYGDIVQIGVTDTYRRIVYKAMAALQWVNTYCLNTDFVIKMDDDVLVDPDQLILSLYRNRNYYSEFIVGELRLNRVPERSKQIKWHMPYEEYSNSSYPPFVPGPVLGYPTSTAALLYQQALRTKTVWLDDIFITGICSQKLGIPVIHDENFSEVHRPMEPKNFIYE